MEPTCRGPKPQSWPGAQPLPMLWPAAWQSHSAASLPAARSLLHAHTWPEPEVVLMMQSETHAQQPHLLSMQAQLVLCSMALCSLRLLI